MTKFLPQRYTGERKVRCLLIPGTELKQKSETELILVARTNRAAFGELYERTVDKVYTYLYYRTKNKALSEDLVSATFLKALENIDRFRPKSGGFTAWLLRIARNLLYDEYRKNNRITQLASGGAETGPGATPEEAVIRCEDKAVLQKMIAALPDLQREAIVLKYTLNLKNKEIASVLGKSETAVSSLLHRAMQALRNEVKTHGLQG